MHFRTNKLEVSMTALSIVSAPEADAHSLQAIARFCCFGLVASICLVTLGMDLSAGWF
jgi:hypothetical protein